jgi:4-hydroxybenzoate polyprenyltransferase
MPAGLKNRALSYSRFVKAEHTLFSLPLIFAGAVLAGRAWPSWRLIGWMMAAGFGARTAAFALNRIIDRKIDAQNPRTANRELPKGMLSLPEAWGVFAGGLGIYWVAAAAIAPICLALSPIPLAIFVIYPYLKRFTPWAHLGVGLADAMAPLGGFIAIRQSLQNLAPGLWLGAFTFFWVAGFDVIYATMDERFDRSAGLYSLPARFGSATALKISGAFHQLAFGCLAILYYETLRTPPGLAALVLIGGLLYWEHRASDNVDLAFFKINAFLGFGVLGLVTAGLGRGL